MPDRDVFNSLPLPFRRAARSLLRTVRGEPHEDLPVAEAFNRLMDGGIPSLPSLLRFLAAEENHLQPSFPSESFAEIERSALRQACGIYADGRMDKLLLQSAIAAQSHGIYDAHHILRDFSMRVLNSVIIESKGGVKDQLTREGKVFDAKLLEECLSPLLELTAYRMQRNPRFKRLGLATRDMGEVSLHEENLLCP